MKQSIHTILGASGAVGNAVIQALEAKNLTYRIVSRSPKPNQANAFQADLVNKEATEKAIAGSTYVYLCVGLPYRSDVWVTQWPIIMQNVLEACEKHQAKLIFLDNIYMYAPPFPVPFDENTPQKYTSTKGEARKRTADLMIEAMEEGKIKGLIGRSADFYGPNAINSSLYISFLERMLDGKNPQTLSPKDIKRTYANVQDNGRALVELALADDCYGQVWHLPVGDAITTDEALGVFNQALNGHFKVSVLPKIAIKIRSFFITPLKEVSEMLYQYEEEYIMSFEKFNKRFPDFKITSSKESIIQMVEWFQNRENSTIKKNW